MTTKLLLYVCNANTSWIEIAITFSEKSKGDTSLPALFHFTCWTKPSTLPHTAAPAVNWLGAPRCLRQMKRCSEQEETTSIAKRSTVLGCSISFVSAFGENSFITYLVLSPKGKPFRNPRIGRLCFWPKGSLTWVQRGDGSYRQPRYTKAVGFLSWFYGFNRNLVKMILMSLEKCNQYLNTIDTLPIVRYIRIIKYYWFELRKL